EITANVPVPPKRDRWWKRKRLAANSTAQSPIAASGRDSAALPSVGSHRELAKTERSTVAARGESVAAGRNSGDQVSAGALSIETESTTPVAAPTFIETPATLVGYVKHPLQQLLEWLDAGMLWLETRLSNIWNWLHGR
ncbi:MAG: hypothetical protein F6K28_52565, partial [Microcoleus sp. SIO2G3]|nr:hypothetical protein [Microcoleus sp. SIO2G3]